MKREKEQDMLNEDVAPKAAQMESQGGTEVKQEPEVNQESKPVSAPQRGLMATEVTGRLAQKIYNAQKRGWVECPCGKKADCPACHGRGTIYASYEALEPAFGLHVANGMTAWRIVKKYEKDHGIVPQPGKRGRRAKENGSAKTLPEKMEVAPRKRGRPSKAEVAARTAVATRAAVSVAKKRGRPSKFATNVRKAKELLEQALALPVPVA